MLVMEEPKCNRGARFVDMLTMRVQLSILYGQYAGFRISPGPQRTILAVQALQYLNSFPALKCLTS